jgi:hypothetical protein
MQAENSQAQAYSLPVKLLIACGAVGPLLFIVAFLIEGAVRPGYSAWHDFVSELSLSNQGWTQIANFLVCGVLVICFAFGLRQVFRSGKGSVWGPLLLGIFGLSLLIAGVFVTDPSLNYDPPGTPGSTWHGMIHGINALLTLCSLTIGAFVLARRFAGDPAWRGWTLYSLITGLLFLAFFAGSLVVAILDQKGILPNSPVGLLQRIAIIIGWGWIALLALRLLRQNGRLADSAARFT